MVNCACISSCFNCLQAFIQFPGVRSAKANQEYVVTRILDSLKTIALLADGDDPLVIDYDKMEPGELATCFNQLEVHMQQA